MSVPRTPITKWGPTGANSPAGPTTPGNFQIHSRLKRPKANKARVSRSGFGGEIGYFIAQLRLLALNSLQGNVAHRSLRGISPPRNQLGTERIAKELPAGNNGRSIAISGTAALPRWPSAAPVQTENLPVDSSIVDSKKRQSAARAGAPGTNRQTGATPSF
jgi:hypothetical protein